MSKYKFIDANTKSSFEYTWCLFDTIIFVSYIINPENTIDPNPAINNCKKELIINILMIHTSINENVVINKNSVK